MPFRIGYYADKITTETLPLEGLTELSINTKNCIVYLLENTESITEVDLFVSASFSTDVGVPLSGSVRNINVISEVGSVPCYVEVKIPGGVRIPKLSFKYNGDGIPDLMLYDYKDDTNWSTPMNIGELAIAVSDSYPNVLLQNAHQVDTLTVSGNFCVCNFHNLKIKAMNFAVTLGSLSILQNSVYSANKVLVKTPHGTHCVAGEVVNTVDSN